MGEWFRAEATIDTTGRVSIVALFGLSLIPTTLESVLVSEDLSRVTPLGNSSGGTVATGVAEGAPECIERVV